MFAVVVTLGALAFRYFLKEDRSHQQSAVAPWGQQQQEPYGDKSFDMYGQANSDPRGEALLDDYDDHYGGEEGDLDPPTPPPASAEGRRPKRRPREGGGGVRQPNFDEVSVSSEASGTQQK